MSVAGERLSFTALFERHPEICIPILQRDYAQGRPAAREVRAAFLQALREALDKPQDDSSLPLDLDFVYGSVDGRGIFSVLDGQQRLTTLMLLHWYLAAWDGETPAFMRRVLPAHGSRFTYAVRPSSREFFDELLEWQPAWPTASWPGGKLSAAIVDQPWFFLSWKMDPTIQSALVMLDDIHSRFADAKGKDFYRRLTSGPESPITFQLLDLESFGLSDDLYIKMNARGKPLTAFETFKARLEEHIESVLPSDSFVLHGREVGAREYLSHRIDTTWADVLWHYRDEKTSLFDEQFMKLVRAVVVVTRVETGGDHDRRMQDLRDNTQSFSFMRYQEADCLDAAFARMFVRLLDAWSGHETGIRPLVPDDGAFRELDFVARLLGDATLLSYAETLQFGAYCGFLTAHPGCGAAQFGDWMRVVKNLSANTQYDRLDDFRRSAQSLRALMTHAPDILAFLASAESRDIAGFYGQQVEEERIKAALLLRSESWRQAIETAERHEYFDGQVEFLLDFARVLQAWSDVNGFTWDKEQEAGRLQNFILYRGKAFAVFNGAGLKVLPHALWERALLAQGDYLLPSGANYSLLENAGRDTSWKRLLRGGQGDTALAKRRLLQCVLDGVDLNIGVEASLTGIVQGAVPDEPWRAVMVQSPEAVAYCGFRNIRRGAAGRIYLLRKSRMSGEHAELLTYVFYRKLKAMGAPVIGPGDFIDYLKVTSDDIEPFIYGFLAGRQGRLNVRIEQCDNQLRIVGNPIDTSAAAALPGAFVHAMTEEGFSVADGTLSALVSFDSAWPLLATLAEYARSFDFGPAISAAPSAPTG
jgi:hypothetical protein